jgi:predicted small lipoprotein YifL
MRTVICCMSLLTVLLSTGCGQMGALQLPSDPDFDKRSKYLLYKGEAESAQTQKVTQEKADSQAAASEIIEQKADSQSAASEITEQN